MRRALLVLCCVAVVAASSIDPTAAAPDPPAYRPPVDAPVLDGFRPPTTRYGPGNRGIQYATEPGTPVEAAAHGRVTFAGQVGGTLHVTVLHPDGVRTTYSFLAAIGVVVGQRIRQGDVVGRTAATLHLGARLGDEYFDPATLFVDDPPRVHLVPFDDPPGSGPGSERNAIGQLIGGLGGLVEGVAGASGAAVGWVRDGGGQLVRTAAHYAGRFTYPGFLLDAWLTGWAAWQRAQHAARRPCSGDEVRPSAPTGRRVALLVAGLGSHSRESTIDQVDTASLGYDRPDVLRFSYAGTLVPDPTDGVTGLPTSDYGAPETQTDLRRTGAALADLVEQVAAAAPRVPIDLYAHSQGGVVVRLALIELERRHGVAWLERLGLVATLGSPHGGADLATGVHAVSATRSGDRALDALADLTHQELDHDAPSVAQLAETSDVVAELRDHPVPDSIDAVSIAARGDVIVPVPRAVAPGMEEVVVPLMGVAAHSDLPGSDAVTRELGLALAGLPPGCQSLPQALLDQAVGEGVSLLEDVGGAVALSLGLRSDVRGA